MHYRRLDLVRTSVDTTGVKNYHYRPLPLETNHEMKWEKKQNYDESEMKWPNERYEVVFSARKKLDPTKQNMNEKRLTFIHLIQLKP
jgi:hypothetical protein